MTTRRTSAGRVITDDDIEALADEAERGYDPAELIARRGKRGRPTLGGAGPSTVESVRLDPELNDEVAERAKRDGVSTSDVIREALRRYLHAG
jgi:predicted transcriptional regulator